MESASFQEQKYATNSAQQLKTVSYFLGKKCIRILNFYHCSI